MGEVVGRMGGLLVLEEVDWCTCASVSPRSKDAGTQSRTRCWCPTYICTVCLPMGARSRKSREMGLIHITTTRTGARKLRWSRTLWRSRQRPPCSLVPPAPSLHPSAGRDRSSPTPSPPSPTTQPPRRPAATESGGFPAPRDASADPLASFPTRRFHPTGSGACRPPSGERQGVSGPGAAPGRSGRRPGRSTGPPAPA